MAAVSSGSRANQVREVIRELGRRLVAVRLSEGREAGEVVVFDQEANDEPTDDPDGSLGRGRSLRPG